MRKASIIQRYSTAALIMATVGLAACSQPVVREQLAALPSEHVVPRDTVLVAASNPVTVLPETDTMRVTSTDGAADPNVSMNRPNGENPAGSLIYASATGSAGGPITQGVTEQGSAWRYRDWTEWHAPLVAASPEGEEGEADAPKSAQCAEFEKDIDADLGAVLKAGCEPTLAQMSALMDNPLGNVAMLFTQFDLTRMDNPANNENANKYNYMGIAQFPKRLNKDWNLINRVIWNVPSMPLDQDKLDDAQKSFGTGPDGTPLPPEGSPPALIDLFDGRTTGFGDMYYNGLFSPTDPISLDGGGKFLWGAGFDLGFPTATEDILGTGKWLAGPSGLGVYLGPKWKVGALAQQFWDFAGDGDRDDVNLTNLQYFVFYSLDETTSIGAAPNIIANWEQDSGNIFTVPVGIGFTKTIQIGKVPVRIGTEIHYSVIKPDDVAGAEWNFRFYVIPALPSALFDWMQ